MDIQELRKMVGSGEAAFDQFAAFMRDAIETMPTDVMVVALDDAFQKTEASLFKASAGSDSHDEHVLLMLDAMRNISHTLSLAGEIQRRGRETIASMGEDAQ